MFRKVSILAAAIACAAGLTSTMPVVQAQPIPQSSASSHFCALYTAYRYTTVPDVVYGTGHCIPTDYAVIAMQIFFGDKHGWAIGFVVHTRPLNLKSGPGLVFDTKPPRDGYFTFSTPRIPPIKVKGLLKNIPNTKLFGLALFSVTGSMSSFASNAFTINPPTNPSAAG